MTRITVNGQEEVVVVSVEEYRRANSYLTGEALVTVMQELSRGELKIERVRMRSRVRPVEL